jgi:SAM-dependent methyltransferase
MAGSRERLDREYARGSWDYLWSLGELARFSVLAGYCHFLKPGGRLLEIGCGEGVLQARLDPARHTRYVGVDISAEPIERARARTKGDGERTAFVSADAAAWEPRETFDLILFNECLEYFEDPLALVRRYEPFLAPDGAFLVSMFAGVDTLRTRRIWRWLEEVYDVEDATRVTNNAGLTWVLKVLRPCASA